MSQIVGADFNSQFETVEKDLVLDFSIIVGNITKRQVK